MKHTKEEIINALKVIKEECESNINCCKCPFGTPNNLCIVARNNPEKWNFNENEPETWRAFK